MADPKAASKPSDVKRATSVSELKDEETLSLEEQLALVEQGLIDEDNAKGDGAEAKSAGSEESDETGTSEADGEVPDEFKQTVQKEVSLQMRNAQLEAENAELRRRQEESEGEDLEDFDYDVGDLDESLEAMREPLNRMGKFHITETKKIEARMNQILERLEARDRQMDAEAVKASLKIEDSEEDAIVKWANDNGLRYHDRKSLTNVVRLYRNEQELQRLQADKTRRAKASANPRTGSTRSQSSREEDTTVGSGKGGRRTFDDSWGVGLRDVNEKLARGERI